MAGENLQERGSRRDRQGHVGGHYKHAPGRDAVLPRAVRGGREGREGREGQESAREAALTKKKTPAGTKKGKK